MSKIYLTRKNLVSIIELMDAFDTNSVEVNCDSSSGIGSVITAKINSTKVNAMTVNVERVISDENDW